MMNRLVLSTCALVGIFLNFAALLLLTSCGAAASLASNVALTALNYAVEPKNNKQPEKNANNSSAPVTSASSQKSTLYGDSLDIVVCQNQMISNLAKIEANKRNLNCELVLANVYEVDIETQGSGAQLFFDFKNRTLLL